MFSRILIIPKLNESAVPTVEKIVQQLEVLCFQQGIECHVAFAGNIAWCPFLVDTNTLAVAVGGDGTMMSAMKISVETGCQCIGINLGNVGFLTDLSAADVSTLFQGIVTGQLPTAVESRIAVEVELSGKRVVAVNELSFNGTYADTMVSYKITIDGKYAGEHRANSILIGTPSGSTAYSLSAGGALLHSSCQCLQIVPVAPSRLTSRPIIVSSSSVINLELTAPHAVSVKADGQLVDDCCLKRLTCVVKSTKQPVAIVHPEQWDFFNTLNNKLGWNR